MNGDKNGSSSVHHPATRTFSGVAACSMSNEVLSFSYPSS
jgi:hypothetical protein